MLKLSKPMNLSEIETWLTLKHLEKHKTFCQPARFNCSKCSFNNINLLTGRVWKCLFFLSIIWIIKANINCNCKKQLHPHLLKKAWMFFTSSFTKARWQSFCFYIQIEANCDAKRQSSCTKDLNQFSRKLAVNLLCHGPKIYASWMCPEGVLKVFWQCREGVSSYVESVWKGSGRYLEGVWKRSEKYLEGFWMLSGMCLESVWKVFWKCLEGIWKVSSWDRAICDTSSQE